MNELNKFNVEMQTELNKEKIKMYPVTKAENVIVSESENLDEAVDKFKSDVTNINNNILNIDNTLRGKLKFDVGYENPPEDMDENTLYGMIVDNPDEE